MITIKEGDLFNAPRGLICHQVNCKGNMGRGVAKTFKEKYPNVFKQYVCLCNDVPVNHLLGTCLFDENTVCMFAQNDWHGYNVCNTNYAAFRNCCRRIADYITRHDRSTPINMPFGIGAGLGGGDWLIIYDILEEEFEGYNLILWRLPK